MILSETAFSRDRFGRVETAPPTGLGKLPEITIVFWIIKIAATTLGETGGDAFSMSMGLGYALSSVVFFALFLGVVAAQIRARSYRPFLYWSVIVATITVGTTLADFADRSLGIGYEGGSLMLLSMLIACLVAWRAIIGSISFDEVASPSVEAFYWCTILLSNTLGTALGDWTADASGLGYGGGAVIFGAALTILAAAYLYTSISRTALFWLAFILTRPLGATVGDLLTKPHENGGLDLSRIASSAVLAAFIVGCILLTRDRTGGRTG